MSSLFDILLRNGYDSYVLTRSLAEESIREENNALLEGVLGGLIESNALENYTIQNIQPDADVNQIVNNSIMTQNITSDGREVDTSAVRSLFNNSIVLQKYATIVNETVTETKYLKETVIQIEERERIVREMVINPLFRMPYIVVLRNDDHSQRSITGYSNFSNVKEVMKSRLNQAVNSGVFENLNDVIPSKYVRKDTGTIGSQLSKFRVESLIPSTIDRLVMNEVTDFIGIYFFGDYSSTKKIKGTDNDFDYFIDNTATAIDINTMDKDETKRNQLAQLIGTSKQTIKKLEKKLNKLQKNTSMNSIERDGKIRDVVREIDYIKKNNLIQEERIAAIDKKYQALRGLN